MTTYGWACEAVTSGAARGLVKEVKAVREGPSRQSGPLSMYSPQNFNLGPHELVWGPRNRAGALEAYVGAPAPCMGPSELAWSPSNLHWGPRSQHGVLSVLCRGQQSAWGPSAGSWGEISQFPPSRLRYWPSKTSPPPSKTLATCLNPQFLYRCPSIRRAYSPVLLRTGHVFPQRGVHHCRLQVRILNPCHGILNLCCTALLQSLYCCPSASRASKFESRTFVTGACATSYHHTTSNAAD